MYLPPLRKPREKTVLAAVELRSAQTSLRFFVFLAVCSVVSAAVLAMRAARNRERFSSATVATRRRGPRVVIVGGGTGGAVVAARVAHALPHCHVTVVERERAQTFHTLTPLALVGHRSYDMNTTRAMDTLRAPMTWCVTRDAVLLHGSVERVLPRRRRVLVRMQTSHSAHTDPTTASPAAATATLASSSSASAVTMAWLRLRLLWSLPRMLQQQQALSRQRLQQYARQRQRVYKLRHKRNNNSDDEDEDDEDDDVVGSEAVMVHEDGSYTRRDGLRCLPYDVLVLACGAERTLGILGNNNNNNKDSSNSCSSCKSNLTTNYVDLFRITVNPGPTRDALAHIYSGNIVHVKVPPRSLVAAVQARQRAQQQQQQQQYEEKGNNTVASSATAAAALPSSSSSCRRIVLPDSYGADDDAALGELLDTLDDTATNTTTRAVSSSLHHNTSSDNNNSSDKEATTLPLLYEARQHEGTFVSSVNVVYKYLDYHAKLMQCRYYAITADATVLPCAPSAVRAAVLRFWSQRRRDSRTRSGKGARFALLTHTYVTALQRGSTGSTVTLYNYEHDVEVVMPYSLLLLDLPLRAPAFVRASGLHRRAYAHDNTEKNNNNEDNDNNNEDNGDANAYEQEASFADVDPQTLRHRRHDSIFAVGDVAGLPTVKSYGATLTQAHVVARNVQLYLEQQQQQQQHEGKDKGVTHSTAAAAAAAATTSNAASSSSAHDTHTALARYDGYTSFPLIMTTWRAMWPEMRYSAAQCNAFAIAAANSDDEKTKKNNNNTDAQRQQQQWHDAKSMTSAANNASLPLEHVDNHLWRNTSWRGVGGVCNAAYYQLLLYEIIYFYIFLRGVWHPPSWFAQPRYSPQDGSVEASRGLLSWL